MAENIYVVCSWFKQSEGWVVSNNLNAWEHLSCLMVGQVKSLSAGKERNSGSPDGRNVWGDGAPVVASKKTRTRINYTSTRSYSTSSRAKGSSNNSVEVSMLAGIAKLEQLIQDNIDNPKLINKSILNIISDVDILIAAYSRIKSNSGNMTPGVDKETLDGVSRRYFEKLSRELRSGSFAFRPARRLEIPKPKGGTRSLGIASPRDKIVQAAMMLALEALFEPSFSVHSHGFRPNRGCHTALGEIKRTFTSVNWFVEGNISKCFDSFDHKLLVHAVEARINDQGFSDLLWKSLKAGYMFQHQYFDSEIGTPQGSVLSPLLCNIYLDQFDLWLEDYKNSYNLGTRRRINPLWRRMTRNGNLAEVHKLHISSRMAEDSNYKRLFWVRYADDFIIGIIGPKSDCLKVRGDLTNFLSKIGMKLSVEKTKITHARDEMAHFLGTDIRITPLNLRPLVKAERNGSPLTMRAGTRPQLLAPISKLVKRLEDRGLARNGGNPTRFRRMIPFENHRIVNHMFSIWRGFKNYYSFVANTGALGRIHYIIKYSCVLTLAAKLRLKTKAQVFNKFGRDIVISKDGKTLASFPEVSLANTGKFNTSFSDPMRRFEKLSRATFRSMVVLDSTCQLCGSIKNVEMHHVRALRKSTHRIKHDYFTAMMSRMNRKQMPVCRECHIKIHGGNKK